MQKQRRKIESSCVACRKKGEQQHFLRYVVGPEHQVVVDYRHRLPGRGAYTCISRSCIEKAVTAKAFDRAFRTKLTNVKPGELVRAACFAISQRIEGLVGIARKAGAIISGTSQLQSSFNRQELSYLLVAGDAAENSAEKMIRMAEQENVTWNHFSDQQGLGKLAGRASLNCIGIKEKQFADLLALEIQSLQQIAGEN